jgi:short-subunit dehydrogenase
VQAVSSIQLAMKMHRRSVGWSAVLAAAGIAVAVIRQQQAAGETQKLAGKVVLITGGSRGLGFAVASELASLGSRLVLIARDQAELERAKARLVARTRIRPEDIFLQAADVSSPDEVRAAVSKATAYFGQIDVVINNAGIIMVGPLESQKLASFQLAMNVNFFGALHTTLAVLPQMLERNDGSIVNIASIGGKVAFPHLLPYVASKFALVGWSQGLRAELSSKGIRVLTVAPGVMRTGSHIQARYTGNRHAEYRWFASAASFPGTATGARSAAKAIVRGIALNHAEIAIGLQAIAASRLANIAPDLTAAMLSQVNKLLPESPADVAPDFWTEDESQAGEGLKGSLPALLEWFGDKPIRQFNQEA